LNFKVFILGYLTLGEWFFLTQFFTKTFYELFFVRFYFFSSCAQRPATTAAKRLAMLNDVAFVGGSFIILFLL
jgi:hypothetical protein